MRPLLDRNRAHGFPLTTANDRLRTKLNFSRPLTGRKFPQNDIMGHPYIYVIKCNGMAFYFGPTPNAVLFWLYGPTNSTNTDPGHAM
jgi:hypothetical protein